MSEETTSWWWVRHAPVTHLQGFVYGDSDPEADVTDLALFQRAYARLPDEAHWVVTNLQRTVQTARAIERAGYALPDLNVEPELREQGFGDWHGLTHDELNRARDDAFIGIWNCPPDEVPPGGESFVELMRRTREAVLRLGEEQRGGNIVCVAHGGTIRAALALALDLPPEQALAFTIDNVSVTRIDRIHAAKRPAPQWRVRFVNA